MRHRKLRTGAAVTLGAVSLVLTALIAGVAGYALRPAHNDTALVKLDRRLQTMESKLDGAIALLKRPVVVAAAAQPTRRKGWHVRAIEPASSAQNIDVLRASHDAGSFVHNGSWINMLQHREHEGIFLPAAAALNSRGLFIPDKAGNYVFAMHMTFNDIKEQRQLRTVACHIDVRIADRPPVIKGKMKANNQIQNATMVAEDKVLLAAGLPEMVDVLVACELPPGVSGKNVAFRICVRHESETGFRPVPAYLPEA